MQISEFNSSATTADTQSVSGGNTSEEPTTFRIMDLNSVLTRVGLTTVTKKDLGTKKAMTQKFQEANADVANKFKDLVGKSLCKGHDCECCNKLLDDLVARFPDAKNSREKLQILTCVPEFVGPTEMMRLFGCSPYRADQAHQLRTEYGAFDAPNFQVPCNKIQPEVEMAAKQFYIDDSNSRTGSGERIAIMTEDIHGQRQRMSKRLILVTLKELYEEFKAKFPEMKIGLTKFSELRPRHCAWPGPKGFHVTCVCVLHENFRVLRAVAGNTEKTGDFIMRYPCVNATADCHLGFCSECPKYNALQNFVEENVVSDVYYQLWQTTDRATLDKITDTPSDYWERFQDFFPKITSHHFIHRMQKEYLQSLKERLKTEETSVVCTVDFGMNYSFIGQIEPQSAHFSRAQATVHPFVVEGMADGKFSQKSYVVLSDELNHNSNSFHVFRSNVIATIKRDFPKCKKIYYVSDGKNAPC